MAKDNKGSLTLKQKQAAIVLAVCLLAIILTTSVVAVVVGKSASQNSNSGSTSGSVLVQNSFDSSLYGDTVLAKTDDAGKSYINETIFVGDSNTERYHRYGLLSLDQVLGVEGLTIEQLTTDQSIYFKNDTNAYTIPQAIAMMKPRRIVVMMGTNNANEGNSASSFAESYASALKAITEAYPYCDVIVAAVPPIPEDHSNYPNISQETINDFNQALAQMCKDEGYKFLDITETLLDASTGYGKAQYYQAGDIHLKKDALTSIMDYARTHAYEGTEDRRPDTSNIPTRSKQTNTQGSSQPSATPTGETFTAQYNVEKNVGGTLTSGDNSGKTSIRYEDLTSKDSVTVKAVADEGYEFVKWSDGNTNATRTDKNFKQNVNVTAMFSAKMKISFKEGTSATITTGESFALNAVLVGSDGNVNDIQWTVDGADAGQGQFYSQDNWSEGTHTIKIKLTYNGRITTAEFTLKVEPKATPTPSPAPTATPTPTPTKAPTPAPTKAPTATPTPTPTPTPDPTPTPTPEVSQPSADSPENNQQGDAEQESAGE